MTYGELASKVKEHDVIERRKYHILLHNYFFLFPCMKIKFSHMQQPTCRNWKKNS